jgi:hypothetical protein
MFCRQSHNFTCFCELITVSEREYGSRITEPSITVTYLIAWQRVILHISRSKLKAGLSNDGHEAVLLTSEQVNSNKELKGLGT